MLWLVPDTIPGQTAEALRNPRHDYRRALELACGTVELVTIEGALRLSRATVEGQTLSWSRPSNASGGRAPRAARSMTRRETRTTDY